MPWTTITLNDGTRIPSIGFGTWRIGNGADTVANVKTAIDTGFAHVDTAQVYRNEVEAGTAIRQYNRDDVYVTTKWSGLNGLSAEESIHNSLKYLGLPYVDLYLIHAPQVAKGDIRGAWAAMERIKDVGLARSIGVSNFDDAQLAELLAHAKHVPAVNQIELHPYVFRDQLPTLAFCAKHSIVIEAYSTLIPLTHTEGPVRPLVGAIAAREKVTPEMVLLAWAKAKGAVVLTTSSKAWRLQDYLSAGDLALTTSDEAAIDQAGAPGKPSVQVATAVEEKVAPVDEKAMLAALEAAEEGAALDAEQLAKRKACIARFRKARIALRVCYLSAIGYYTYMHFM